MFSPFLPAPANPNRPAHERRAAVAACLLPLLGITAATAALLLNAGPPGPLGWSAGAAGLLAHAWLLRGVARSARSDGNRSPRRR